MAAAPWLRHALLVVCCAALGAEGYFYYRFDDSDMRDSGTYGYDGPAAMGRYVQAFADCGLAYEVSNDANTATVMANPANTLPTGDRSWTLSFYVNVQSPGQRPAFVAFGECDNRQDITLVALGMVTGTSGAGFWRPTITLSPYNAMQTYVADQEFPVDEWHRVVVLFYIETTMRMYVNPVDPANEIPVLDLEGRLPARLKLPGRGGIAIGTIASCQAFAGDGAFLIDEVQLVSGTQEDPSRITECDTITPPPTPAPPTPLPPTPLPPTPQPSTPAPPPVDNTTTPTTATATADANATSTGDPSNATTSDPANATQTDPLPNGTMTTETPTLTQGNFTNTTDANDTTDAPPTDAPPTRAPGLTYSPLVSRAPTTTMAPPTSAPKVAVVTGVPLPVATAVPPGSKLPDTGQPATDAPADAQTRSPVSRAPLTPSPTSAAPGTSVPRTSAPRTRQPLTARPPTPAPSTAVPVPVSEVPTGAPGTAVPAVVTTLTPRTRAPGTRTRAPRDRDGNYTAVPRGGVGQTEAPGSATGDGGSGSRIPGRGVTPSGNEQLKTVGVAAAAGGVAGVLIGATAGAAGGAAKLALIRNLACKVEDVDLDEGELDWEFYPLGIPIGDASDKYAVGATLLNPMTLGVTFVVFFLLAALLKHIACIAQNGTWDEASAYLRFPGLLYIPYLFLLQGTSLVGAQLAFFLHQSTMAASVGFLMMVVCILSPVVLWYFVLRKLKKRAVADWDPRIRQQKYNFDAPEEHDEDWHPEDASAEEMDEKLPEAEGSVNGANGGVAGDGGRRPSQNTDAPHGHKEKLLTGWTRRFYLFAFGDRIWVSVDGGYFCETVGVVFEAIKPKCLWFIQFELGSILTLSLLSAWRPVGGGACTLRNVLVCLVCGILVFVIARYRPFISPLENLITFVIALSMLLGVVLISIAIVVNDPDNPVLPVALDCLLLSGYLVIAKAAMDIAGYIVEVLFGRRREARRIARRKANGEPPPEVLAPLIIPLGGNQSATISMDWMPPPTTPAGRSVRSMGPPVRAASPTTPHGGGGGLRLSPTPMSPQSPLDAGAHPPPQQPPHPLPSTRGRPRTSDATGSGSRETPSPATPSPLISTRKGAGAVGFPLDDDKDDAGEAQDPLADRDMPPTTPALKQMTEPLASATPTGSPTTSATPSYLQTQRRYTPGGGSNGTGGGGWHDIDPLASIKSLKNTSFTPVATVGTPVGARGARTTTPADVTASSRRTIGTPAHGAPQHPLSETSVKNLSNLGLLPPVRRAPQQAAVGPAAAALGLQKMPMRV